MGLVHKQQVVFWKIIQKRKRRAAWFPSRHDSGIVFNSLAKADFLKHFNIIPGSLLNTLGLQQLSLPAEICQPFFQLLFDFLNSLFHFFLGDDVVRRRVNSDMLQIRFDFSGQRIKLADPVHFITEKLHPHCRIIGLGWKYFHYISSYPELVSDKVYIISLILKLYQFL